MLRFVGEIVITSADPHLEVAGSFPSAGYRELADRLVPHVKNMNFTHVEFLPLAHHPFEGSWGYQVSPLPLQRLHELFAQLCNAARVVICSGFASAVAEI